MVAEFCFWSVCHVEKERVNLFYVEEVLCVKGDGCGGDWNVFIQRTTVADVCPHSKRHRFGLWGGSTGSQFSSFRVRDSFHRFFFFACQLGYLSSLELNGGQLLPLLSVLSRSLALAGALALDLGLHLALLLQRDIWVWWSASVWVSWALSADCTQVYWI